MIGKKKNHSIFTKYLLSYLILLILPIILITFFVSKTVFQSLSAEVSENNNISNNLITYSLENELNVCSKIATHINASRDIHPFTLESNAIKAMDLIDTLKNIKLPILFLIRYLSIFSMIVIFIQKQVVIPTIHFLSYLT